MRTKPLLVALSVLALAVPTAALAQAAPKSGPDRFTPAPGVVSGKFVPRSLQANAKVNVIVEMAGDPVAVVQAKSDRKLSSSEKKAIRANLKAKQDAVSGDIAAKGGKVTAKMQSAYNGVAVTVSQGQVEALRALPGVVGVHSVALQTPDNSVAVPYLGVPSVWQDAGFTGKGVKVGVIDTGIDYTHADFGGPGTAAAWTAASASSTQPANPSLFGAGAPRVKGGYDFAGDGYDASGDEGSVTPTPDANPLDCASAGHGTHVAGSAAGGGVDADGNSYAGPYNSTTASKDWKVGPGVAPEADIYAYRVFGCFGSTDLTTQAIDRAVADGMDVINMSLGSPFGTSDDPSAIAASNAVGAGVVVVTSAGNSGHNPYIVGSPSTGGGVVSVAAMDSTESFPGVKVDFSDGLSVTAINANGFTPLPSGSLNVVVLKDDPATVGTNEALGCSVAAYTSNGIVAGQNQLAVSTRGLCARVAKAVYADQAGAAAALMINTDANYPPFEGQILSNPDDGQAYEVDIPFLGVRNSDGATVRGEAGNTATLSAQTLPNPGFTGYASFTSGGPRTFDSAIRPSVTAPGVSISSAAVGSGTGSEIMSGTSMASPMVAGVAALVKESHKSWSSQDLAAALVTTANSAKTAGYRLTLGGEGEVNPAAAVSTQSVLLGDKFTTSAGTMMEPALSFGFAETSRFKATKVVTVKNNGTSTQTFTLSSMATPQSKPGSITIWPNKVTVPAGGSATAKVTLRVNGSDIPSSEGQSFQFFEVSGSIVATPDAGPKLAIPYLLVPRAKANAEVSTNGRINDRNSTDGKKDDGKGGKKDDGKGGVTAKFTNKGGAVPAGLDVYAWGISDRQDLPVNSTTAGMDVRAVGVQSFASDDVMVFAVNNWTRYSNAALLEYDVQIDTNKDGDPDYIVFSADFGALTTGTSNGQSAVFLYDVAGGSAVPQNYTVAPTDSSTVLLPISISSLGLTESKGTFSYTVQTFTGADSTVVDSTGTAMYNPFSAPLVGEGQYATVAPGKSVSLQLPINKAAYKAFRPLGAMVVAFDNAAGPSEALLIKGNR